MLDKARKAAQRGPVAALALLAFAIGCNSSNPPAPPVDVPADVAPDIVVPIDVPVDMGPPRCTSSASCAGMPGRPICDMASGACVSCATMSTACTAAQYCNTATGACDMGCSRDEACAMATGDGGVTLNRCDPLTRACVQCVTNDHCPPGTTCRGSTCVAGCNAMRPCPMGQSCCDNACIDTQSNVAACGMCGNTCRVANGSAECMNGACAVRMCTMPYQNCDMNAANGCEVNTEIDAMNCGACGTACMSGENATAACESGRCALRCNAGFGDCDMNPANGCETDLRANNTHCGTCGRACAPRSATGTCAMSACGIDRCNTGFGDCDMDPSTGCESSTATDPLNCGMCGRTCRLANAIAGCAMGACTIARCEPGFADCDGMAANGCEVNTDESGSNCGRCGTSCGMGMCSRGLCTTTCGGGLGDCDGTTTNGCEAMLNTDVFNCGGCRRSCASGPQSRASCAAGVCGLTCNMGYADCNRMPNDGCEVDVRLSSANCGRCGNACPSGQVCNDGTCVMPCPGVQTRCSGACVSLLNDNANCGACGTVCPSGSTCTDGLCRCPITGMPTGGLSCRGTCINPLTDNANCGTCGTACPTGAACSNGVCRCPISGVPVGVVCGTACIDPFADRNNCGGCGRACATGESCLAGACRCGSVGMTGTTCSGTCTDTQTDRSNCGACGRACGAVEACVMGACRTCATGTTFCADSCVDVTTSAVHCGRCGNTCPTGQVCVGSACTSAPPTRYTRVERPAGLTFVPACGAPGASNFLAGADDSNVVVTIPFALRYWATLLPAGAPINITSNGWIGLDGVSTATYNFPIPTTATPNAVVAGYEGDDQNRGPQCVAVLGTAPTRRWVHQWDDAQHCCGSQPTVHHTYEIILNEGSNVIEFVYQRMDGARSQYVGLENQTGSEGIGGCPGGAFQCVPAAGYSVRFVPSL